MSIDDFGPNLSFFFHNGIDPEYAVIGRVARRIWAKAMKLKYGAETEHKSLNITFRHLVDLCTHKKLILMIFEQAYKPYMLFMTTVIHYTQMLMMKPLQPQQKNLSEGLWQFN